MPGPLVPPREIRRRRRLGGRALGGARHRALLPAGGVPRHQGDIELHVGGRRRCAGAQPRRVGAPRPVLVSRAYHKRLTLFAGFDSYFQCMLLYHVTLF